MSYGPADPVGASLYSHAPMHYAPRPEDYDPVLRARRQAKVVITEQPASKALRFRYECEGRSAGSIPGAHSTADSKTFPSVKVVGYRGPAVVVVSCVTKDPPHWPHPHNLVGKDGCKKGVCTVNLNVETMSVTFQNLGIQCVKKKDVEDSLRQREAILVDPFRTGFDHRLQPTAIDLNTVRLCFQVFVEGHEPGKFVVPLTPVVSDPIFDKKSMCDLVIYKMSDCSASAAGGRDIILLCDKVTKDDIEVRFFEVRDNRLYWEGFGEFLPADVHKQVAICFKTPRYANPDLDTPVRVQIQLRRPSDKQYSESRAFTLTPVDCDGIEEKKRKMARNSDRLHRFLAENLGEGEGQQSFDAVGARPKMKATSRHRLKTIKPEPVDPVPEPMYPGGDVPAQGIVSPTSMSGGGIVRQPTPYELQQRAAYAARLAAPTAAAADLVKQEYPAMYAPGSVHRAARSPQQPGAAPASPLGAAAAPPTSAHQLLDLDTQRPVSSSIIELDLSQLNSADLNMLSFPSESEANQQAIEGHLSSNLSQSLNFLDMPPPPQALPAEERPDAQMDSFTRNTISELEFLNQLSKK
ncbi:putative transcription factor p65 homolog [Amphibalanus amphitrite]|uniref:putative transcription factor p65 homolog n=1 Tax=Amphibalanus amphitrite TaxID=1232801 RepID=UPI001C90CD08|nr:putative transcription factor p65 homolog [Amphibalanus amphitrite]XP_043210761.1 putative transcription factor p65 homolog [Amphibalanus amphitrite]